MATLSAFYNFDSTGSNRGIPSSQFTSFQYNTGGNAWYNRVLRSNNNFFGTGFNNSGQLGLGDNTSRTTFTPLTGNWSQMECGEAHTMALSAGTTNKWFGTGFNGNGQLGLGDNTSRTTFTPLTGNWSQMVCGSYYTIALSAGTNKWFGTGSNNYGGLGLGDNILNRNTFTQLTGDWSQMVCDGYQRTMALSAGTNKWFGTGFNNSGQLGLGDYTSRTTFTPLTGNWSQMVCGSYHTMALSAGTNKWFGTGSNNYGGLGLGDNTDRTTFTQLTGDWSQIVCGSSHTMALSTGTNKLFGTGYNFFGQLGLGDNTNRTTFTPLTGNWNQVTCESGGMFSMALSAGTGKWFGTGSNSGQLGLGDNINRTTFTQLTGNWSQMVCGQVHTMAMSLENFSPVVVEDIAKKPINFKIRPITNLNIPGEEISFNYNPSIGYFAVGSNTGLDLGDTTPPGISIATQFMQTTGSWDSIVIGGQHTFAKKNNEWYACGVGPYAGTGTSYTTFTKITGNWDKIVGGTSHSIALSGKKLFVTGATNTGGLGTGSTLAPSLATFTEITLLSTMGNIIHTDINIDDVVCGGWSNYVLSANTKTWFSAGDNSSGQLGLGFAGGVGSNRYVTRFTQMTGNWDKIVTGKQHIFLLSAGTTDKWYACGSNLSFGQLGFGSSVSVNSPIPVLSGKWDTIKSSEYCTYALSGRKLYTCGENSEGQLGQGNFNTHTLFTPITGEWDEIETFPICYVCFARSGLDWYVTGDGTNYYNSIGTTVTTFTKLTGSWESIKPAAFAAWGIRYIP